MKFQIVQFKTAGDIETFFSDHVVNGEAYRAIRKRYPGESFIIVDEDNFMKVFDVEPLHRNGKIYPVLAPSEISRYTTFDKNNWSEATEEFIKEITIYSPSVTKAFNIVETHNVTIDTVTNRIDAEKAIATLKRVFNI